MLQLGHDSAMPGDQQHCTVMFACVCGMSAVWVQACNAAASERQQLNQLEGQVAKLAVVLRQLLVSISSASSSAAILEPPKSGTPPIQVKMLLPRSQHRIVLGTCPRAHGVPLSDHGSFHQPFCVPRWHSLPSWHCHHALAVLKSL